MAAQFGRRRAGEGVVEEARLPHAPNDRFLLAHGPAAWDFFLLAREEDVEPPPEAVHATDEDGEPTGDLGIWLPAITHWAIIPGLNGIRAGKGGHVYARARFESEGWHFLPLDAPVWRTDPGTGRLVQGEGYLEEVDAVWGGRAHTVYVDVWSHPELIGHGASARVDWRARFDQSGWDATRLEWRRRGLVGELTAAVVALRLGVQRRRAARRVKVSHLGSPHLVALAEHEDRRLVAMRTTAEQLGQPGTALGGGELRRIGDTGRRRKVTSPDAEIGGGE